MLKKNKKVPIIIAVIVVAVLLILVIVPKMMPEGLPKVAVEAVTKGDLTSKIDTGGTVESLKTKTYFSPVNAAVAQAPYKVGQIVKPGDSLVVFNTENLDKDNQKAQLNVSATLNGNQDNLTKAAEAQQKANDAAGQLSSLQASVDSYQDYIASLKTAIADRTRELTEDAAQSSTELTAALTKAQAELQKLQQQTESETMEQTKLQTKADTLEQQIWEMKEKDPSADTARLEEQQKEVQKKLDEIQTTLENLKVQMNDKSDEVTNLQVAQAQNQSGQASASDAQIVEWQNEMENAAGKLTELQSELAEKKSLASSADSAKITSAARAQMQATNNIAELEAASLEELLEKGREGIKADFSGIVSKTAAVDGAAVSQGMELITVSSNEEVAVNVSVSKYDYDKLKEGQKASITIADNTYEGVVSGISRMATVNEKGSPVIGAEVKITNPDDNIFLGVEAKVSIETSSVKDVVRVPVNAVNTGKDSTFCYIVKDGVITKQDITAGISSTEYTEIKSGLKVGDAVIAELPDGFKEGMHVEAAGADEIGAAGQAAKTAKE